MPDADKDIVSAEEATYQQLGDQLSGPVKLYLAANLSGVSVGGGGGGGERENENGDMESGKQEEIVEESCQDEALDFDAEFTVEAARMELDRLLSEIEAQRRSSACHRAAWTRLVQARKDALAEAVGVVESLEKIARELEEEEERVHQSMGAAYRERNIAEVRRLSDKIIPLMDELKSAKEAAAKAKQELKALNPEAAAAEGQSKVC